MWIPPTLSTKLKAFSVFLINKQTFLFMKISVPFETLSDVQSKNLLKKDSIAHYLSVDDLMRFASKPEKALGMQITVVNDDDTLLWFFLQPRGIRKGNSFYNV